MATTTTPTPHLPNAPCVTITPGISIQPPLSRRGTGPGLIVVVPSDVDLGSHEKTLDPPPRQKWAEESYAVAQIVSDKEGVDIAEKVAVAIGELGRLRGCDDVRRIGLMVVGEEVPAGLLKAVGGRSEIVAAVFYGCAPAGDMRIPALAHLPGRTGGSDVFRQNLTTHRYNGAGSFFVVPAHDDYRASSAAVAHTRSLSFLKPLMGGPYFDLEAIWEEHTRYEFAERSVEETMATMVQEPYVNHVPTLTGGVGRERLTSFYRDHFIFSNSDDVELELVSRTVGIDRVVDEFLFNCTHDRVIDWLIPGVPPTFKRLSIPFIGIINIRGDRLYHEHISWDQGTVLRQLGLLPEYLPFPYALPDGRMSTENGTQLEYRVPVAGVETARKLVDENAVPSNTMVDYRVRELDRAGH